MVYEDPSFHLLISEFLVTCDTGYIANINHAKSIALKSCRHFTVTHRQFKPLSVNSLSPSGKENVTLCGFK